MSTAPREPRRIQPWSIWLILAFLLGGVLVSVNYVKKNRAEAQDPRPPYLGKLERDLTGENRDGTTVSLSRLKGQIWIASSLYTGSPAKSAEVLRLLRQLWEEFGSDPRLHLVVFSVDPAGDSAEKRTAFFREHGVDDPRWWYLTAPPKDLARYMIRYLRWMPTRAASGPDQVREWGPLQHDVRVVLVDGKANLRGHFQLLHPQSGSWQLARLRQDLQYLLTHSE